MSLKSKGGGNETMRDWKSSSLVFYCPLLAVQTTTAAVSCWQRPLLFTSRTNITPNNRTDTNIMTHHDSIISLIWVQCLTFQTRFGWAYWLPKRKILSWSSNAGSHNRGKVCDSRATLIKFYFSLYLLPFYLPEYVVFCHDFMSAQQPSWYLSLLKPACCSWD